MEMLIRCKLTIPHVIFCEFIKLSLVIFLSIIEPGNNWTAQALHGLKYYPFEQPSQIKGVWQHCTSWLCNHFNCHSDHLINMREYLTWDHLPSTGKLDLITNKKYNITKSEIEMPITVSSIAYFPCQTMSLVELWLQISSA